jgi:hypothetical protein
MTASESWADENFATVVVAHHADRFPDVLVTDILHPAHAFGSPTISAPNMKPITHVRSHHPRCPLLVLQCPRPRPRETRPPLGSFPMSAPCPRSIASRRRSDRPSENSEPRGRVAGGTAGDAHADGHRSPSGYDGRSTPADRSEFGPVCGWVVVDDAGARRPTTMMVAVTSRGSRTVPAIPPPRSVAPGQLPLTLPAHHKPSASTSYRRHDVRASRR